MAIKTKYFNDWLEKVPHAPEKVIAITGTTSGVGYWAAVFAIRKNVKALLLLNRDSPRVVEAYEKLQAEKNTYGSSTKIHNIICDLSDADSVRKAATQVNELCKRFGGLDILANNAGLGTAGDYRSKEGYDIQMQINYFSHFLLAKCVFPSFDLALEHNREVRICQQSSASRYNPQTPHHEKYFLVAKEGDLGGNTPNAGIERYHQSKLANITFALKLSKMLKEKGYDTKQIKSICSEPGFSDTELVTNSTADRSVFIKLLAKIFIRVMQFTTKRQSAADGSLTLAHACLAEDVANGDFFHPNEFSVGIPVKSIAGGKLDHGKPEHEKLCLDSANQDLCWKFSEQAYGDFFEFAKL